MRPKYQRFHLPILAVSVLLVCGQAQATLPPVIFDPALAAKADAKFDRTTYWKLQALTVSVNYQSSSLQAVVRDLFKKSSIGDPEGKGIKFMIDLRGGDLEIAKQVPDHVSLTLTGVSLFDILQYLSSQTHLIPLIHQDVVILVPGKETRLSMPPNWEPPPNTR